jgi:phosphoglycolate phosphatase/pyrophosphatase PpaX
MLKYPCLILDHDDTVVQSEKTIGYPFFCRILSEFRPGETISLGDYVRDCHNYGFAEMCKRRWNFTDKEQSDEYRRWMDYVKTHIPDAYPGIGDVIRRQKEEGGLICVVSQCSQEHIHRDYLAHFGMLPDEVYGWDLAPEQRKPSPWSLEQIMEKYDLSPAELLVVDDMKAAVSMARAAGTQIAFAGWGRTDFPEITAEMTALCDYSFYSTEEFEKFLFE